MWHSKTDDPDPSVEIRARIGIRRSLYELDELSQLYLSRLGWDAVEALFLTDGFFATLRVPGQPGAALSTAQVRDTLAARGKDVLEKAGLEVPQTCQDVLAAAPAVMEGDQTAIAMRAVPGQGFNMFICPMVTRAHGGTFFKDYTGGDLTPAINPPETLEALGVYSKRINGFAPLGAGNFNFSEVNAAAQNGQIVFAVEGTGVVAQIVDPEKNQYAEVTGLALPAGGPAGPSPAIAVHGLGIPALAPDPEMSDKFIEWAVSPAAMTKIALSEPFANFTTIPVAQNAEVIAKYEKVHPDFVQIQADALNLAIGHHRPLLPEWPALGAAIGENINAAVNGLISHEEALENAEAEMADSLGQ